MQINYQSYLGGNKFQNPLPFMLTGLVNKKVDDNDEDCKRSEACLHSGYNRVELSRFEALWGFNCPPFGADLSGRTCSLTIE